MVKCERCEGRCEVVRRCWRCDRQIGTRGHGYDCWERGAPWCVDCMQTTARKSSQDGRPRATDGDRGRQSAPLRRQAVRGGGGPPGLPALRDRVAALRFPPNCQERSILKGKNAAVKTNTRKTKTQETKSVRQSGKCEEKTAAFFSTAGTILGAERPQPEGKARAEKLRAKLGVA